MIIKQKHNDAGWQPLRTLKVPINLQIGDKLSLICDYNSISQTKTYTVKYLNHRDND